MKKLVLLLSALILGLVLVGCTETSDDSISVDKTDPVSLNMNSGETKVVNYAISASEVVSENNITVTFENADGTSAMDLFTAKKSSFDAQYTYLVLTPQSEVTLTASASCPTGTYIMKITADLGTSSSTQKVTLNVTGVNPVEITSVADATVDAGSTGATTAVIKNGDSLTKDDFSVTVAGSGSINANDSVPTASIASYVSGTVTITINATAAKVGTFTGTLKTGSVEKNFTITVEQGAVALTEMTQKLYNPYAKDGYNSAYNMVTGDPVAGTVGTDGKMVYAASDSLVADIAVDNSEDIRPTNVVAELTSINGGLFAKITKAQYEAASTDVAVKALVAASTIEDGDDTNDENEVIITDDDDITVDGYFVMKLMNKNGVRGYAVVQMAELNKLDSEGSTGNTGYLKINYKYTAK